MKFGTGVIYVSIPNLKRYFGLGDDMTLELAIFVMFTK